LAATAAHLAAVKRTTQQVRWPSSLIVSHYGSIPAACLADGCSPDHPGTQTWRVTCLATTAIACVADNLVSATVRSSNN